MVLESLSPLRLVQCTVGLADPPAEFLAKVKAAPTMVDRLLLIGDTYGDRVKPHPMRRTPVLMLVRNAKIFVQLSLPKMQAAVSRALRAAGHVDARFYILENDSDDGTRAELRKLAGPLVVTCFDRLPAHRRPCGHPRSSSRCAPMAMLRNALRVMALRDLAHSPIAIMVDVDMWFTATALKTLIQALHTHKLDMATPLSLQTRRHYFDTYALVLKGEDPAKIKDRRDCILDGCEECRKWREFKGVKKARRPPVSNKLIRVRSAFGGLAVIRSDHLRGKGRCWSSDHDLCEHVAFCEDKEVAIVTAAPARWTMETPAFVARRLNQHFLV